MWAWIKRLLTKKAQIDNSAPIVIKKPVEVTTGEIAINQNKVEMVTTLVAKFHATRERYHVVSKMTGVPEDVLFACHYRESSLSFKGVLHNGERIIGTNQKTILVPKGRGPFETWEEAAIDAMEIEQSKFPKTWDISGKLDFCERYNGLGYRKKGVPSPYVYSWTNKYSKGKYVADGKYDQNFVDQQCGTAAIILGINQ